ncbi:hypothetical protein [Hyphococcus sp. DH-69]|uniref:hypothetical protein n=1 Tax=Hyphococcus formosus TaxID=3143534 RepID=UPI00398AA1F1
MRSIIGAVIAFFLGFMPAHAEPVTYQILLEGEGFSNGEAVSISGTGSFVWDSEDLVDFNDYCVTDCGNLPTLALIKSINFDVPQLGLGIHGNDTASLGIFDENYGYLFFNGSGMLGFCLVTQNAFFGCEQAGDGMPSGNHSGTRAIFLGDANQGAPFQFNLAGNDWQYSGVDGSSFNGTASGTIEIQAVPIPAALPMFLSALFGFGAFRWLS